MSDAIWSEVTPSVIHTAEELIQKYHPWLKDARIAFVFRNEAQKLPGGREYIGHAEKVSEKAQQFMEYDFLIWLSEKDYERMTDQLREALIDHELCHCYRNTNYAWAIRPHDIQEFSEIIQRHGAWAPDVQRAKMALNTYETETLPGLLEGAARDLFGKVEAIKGKNLAAMQDQAEQA